MPRVVRTRQARRDLLDIWSYIAADSPTSADAVLRRIDRACARLARHPLSGPSRDDIRPGLRHATVEPYVVLYRVLGDAVEIVRVVHGRRDLVNLL